MLLKKVILVVDDNKVNRRILSKILSENYQILTADNGKEALETLEKQGESVAGIMLDLVMPVMNGYEFLEALRNTPYHDTPVVVTTGSSDQDNETRALDLGAWDFVPKPYNAKVLLSRLRNAIARSEMAAFEQLKYMTEFDALTGLYNKNKFFEVTKMMLKSQHSWGYAFIRMDVNRFSLINSFYGAETGDKLLKYIAEQLNKLAEKNTEMTYGRIEADEFAFCLPRFGIGQMEEIDQEFRKALKKFPLEFNIVMTFGIYLIKDITVPMHKMLDYANLATKKIKGNYLDNYAFYSKEMSEALETEQRMVNEMNEAMEQGQFQVYLQPKYDLHTDRPAGAEALVRWKHPERGMISPKEFIPVFERNGFISKLDYYMWEHVCQLLAKWRKEGLKPYPLSVNVSRVNLYNPRLVQNLCELTNRYEIPRELLQLELTESVYTENQDIMTETLTSLHEEGFTVLMDDFGSGYSSLNILKDIDIDILKIDMGFFDKSKISGRGENIIFSVVRMAKWLNIPTIAEGVERSEQVDFLREIGCQFVQGYYFAKPMPVEDYEALVGRNEAFVSEKKGFKGNSLWENSPQMELLFSDMQQAVAICEFDQDQVEVLRVNQAFYDLFGYEDESLQERNALNVVREEDRSKVCEAFHNATKTGGIAECEYQRMSKNLAVKWIRMTLKYVDSIGGKGIALCSLFDITAQKEMEYELEKYRLAAGK